MNHSAPDRFAVSRRSLLAGSLAGVLATAMPSLLATDADARNAPLLDEVTIDLEIEPASLDPALGDDVNGWSVIHSIYDSVVNIGPDGQIQPLLAETVDFPDPLICRIVLRPDRFFQDGTPVTAESVQAAIEHIRDPKTGSLIVDNFAPIESITIVDGRTVKLGLSAPAPYLPAQFAPWLTPFPAGATGSLGETPVGAGPYRFVSWESGERIVLEAAPNYPSDSPKGRPIAKRVVFRFVPDPTTRVADLLSGSASIIRAVPPDQVSAVEGGGALVVSQPVTGIAFVRIANDVEPFTDPRVRQALNHAIDVQAIIDALLNGNGARLASLFPEGGLGFDPGLAPMAFDPELARSLLADAGYPDGFAADMEHTTDGSQAIPEAIVGMLSEVGIDVTLKLVETATFNATWTEGAPLRYLTWRPVNDPYTLLNLVFSKDGFLSRFSSDPIQELIDAAAVEIDQDRRAELYRQLGAVLQEDPAAIYLNSLVSLSGVAEDVSAWTSRGDDYTLPTVVEEG
jgi:peptide/nickel transport system substrate-binding protein